jgi:hypothetical protein
MRILVGDSDTKFQSENILKPTVWNVSLYGTNNGNGVRVGSFAISKHQVIKSAVFPHQNINNYTWTSPDVKTGRLITS